MRDTVIVLVGAVAAILLQVIVAPNIAIMSAMPNFILAYVGIVAMLRQENWVLVLAFFLGLAYDLLGSNPVGIMSALLVLTAFVAGRVFRAFDNDTIFVPLIISMVCSLVVEIAYAAILLLCGMDVPVFDAVFLRALPCAFYDAAMALILFPILTVLMKSSSAHPNQGSPNTTVRFR